MSITEVKLACMEWIVSNQCMNATITGDKESMNAFAHFIAKHIDLNPEQAVKEFNYFQPYAYRVTLNKE